MLRATAWIMLVNALFLGVIAWFLQTSNTAGYWLVVPYLPIAIGSLVWIFGVPVHLLEAFRSWRLQSRLGTEYPETLVCPVTSESTTSLKQFRIPTRIRFLVILFSTRQEEVVASPSAMRSVLLRTFAFDLLPGNLLTLFYLPTFITLYCRTFTSGHSSRLFHKKHGLLPPDNSAVADDEADALPVVVARGKKFSRRRSRRHHGMRVHA